MNSIIDRIACDLSLDRIYIKSIIQRSAFYYKRFTIPKQNGDQRVIYQASPELKSLQYWVREKILKLLPISEAAFAYQTGSSIKKHILSFIQISKTTFLAFTKKCLQIY